MNSNAKFMLGGGSKSDFGVIPEMQHAQQKAMSGQERIAHQSIPGRAEEAKFIPLGFEMRHVRSIARVVPTIRYSHKPMQ